MQSQLRGITALLFSTVIFLMGNGLVGTLIPLRASLEGFSSISVGALGAWYFAGFVAGCYGGPQLLSRVGHIRSFAVASALIAASIILMPIWATQASWSVLRGLTGVCTAVMFMAIESWLNDRATNETRGRILAIYIGANFGALLIGQWMLLLGLPTSFELFSIAAILYCVCLVPIGLTRLPAPQPPQVPRLNLERIFRIAPVGAAGCLTVGSPTAHTGCSRRLCPVARVLHTRDRAVHERVHRGGRHRAVAARPALRRHGQALDHRDDLRGGRGCGLVLGASGNFS